MVTHQQSNKNKQEYIDDKTLDSELDSIHMDCHKATFLDPSIGVEVCDPTLTEFRESDHFKESDFDHSIGAHQSRDIKQENPEDDVENNFVFHQAHASFTEDDVQKMENLSQSLNTENILKEYAPLEREKFQSIQEGLESVPDEFHITSLVSHQLQAMAICDQFEYLDYISSMASHQDMPTIDEDEEEADMEANLGSMITHMAHNASFDDDNLVYTPDETEDEQSSWVSMLDNPNNEADDSNEYDKLVSNNDLSYTEGNKTIRNKKDMPQNKENVSSKCKDKRPVGKDEEEEISDSYENFVNAAKKTYNDTMIKACNSTINRIQELQKVVEDEIEEFENKRNNEFMTENNVETTETHIVSNVKGVKFKSCIVIHQELNEKYVRENTEENYSDDESLFSTTESIDSVILAGSENLKNDNESNLLDAVRSTSSSEENLIQASCTIENNSPVIITTNYLQSDDLDSHDESTEENMEHEYVQESELESDQKEENMENGLSEQNLELHNQQEENENDDQFNDLKKHLRKMPRKSSIIETKIRETELLNSLFQDSSKQSAEPKEQEKCQTKVQEKLQKSSMMIATLNEKDKKQTYKIRFEVKLNANSSKSSVLQYLSGCFGGEKLLHQQ